MLQVQQNRIHQGKLSTFLKKKKKNHRHKGAIKATWSYNLDFSLSEEEEEHSANM
jgi:hypothetical protein